MAHSLGYPPSPGSQPFLLGDLQGRWEWCECLVPTGFPGIAAAEAFASLSLYFQGSPGPAGPRGSIGRPGFWGRKVNIISHWFQMRGTEGSYISSLTVWKFFTWWLNPSTMLNHLHAASGFSPISGWRLPYCSPVSRKLPLLEGESYLPFTKHCWESLQFPYSLSSNAFAGWDEWIDLNLFPYPLSVSPRLTMAKVAVVEMDKSQQLASCAHHSSAFVLQALGSVWLQRSPARFTALLSRPQNTFIFEPRT